MSLPCGPDLASKKCRPCEGGVPRYSAAEAEQQLGQLRGWRLTHDAQRIRRDWAFKSFKAAMQFLNQVAALAEAEGHHPDLHLERYRHVWIELWTHAVGGLSENDVIMAAKIDQVEPGGTTNDER